MADNTALRCTLSHAHRMAGRRKGHPRAPLTYPAHHTTTRNQTRGVLSAVELLSMLLSAGALVLGALHMLIVMKVTIDEKIQTRTYQSAVCCVSKSI